MISIPFVSKFYWEGSERSQNKNLLFLGPGIYVPKLYPRTDYVQKRLKRFCWFLKRDLSIKLEWCWKIFSTYTLLFNFWRVKHKRWKEAKMPLQPYVKTSFSNKKMYPISAGWDSCPNFPKYIVTVQNVLPAEDLNLLFKSYFSCFLTEIRKFSTKDKWKKNTVYF